MKVILVPTDFSENANTAIEYACELGNSISAEVLITHVYTPAVTKNNIINSLIQDEINEARKLAEEKLKIITNTINKQYTEIESGYEFRVGAIVDEVNQLVSSKKINLIVMGTEGASGIGKYFFGSNTSHIIERGMCPVLAVPKDSPFHPPKRIVYATDFNDKELKKLVNIISIAEAFNAEITMTHITTEEAALLSEEMLKRNFANRVKEIYDYSPISYLVKYEESIIRALDTIVDQVNADWIAMLTHKRSFFEEIYDPSLTKEMAFHSKIPLLALT